MCFLNRHFVGKFQALYLQNFSFPTVRYFFPVCVLTPCHFYPPPHLREGGEARKSAGGWEETASEPSSWKVNTQRKASRLGAGERNDRGERNRREHRLHGLSVPWPHPGGWSAGALRLLTPLPALTFWGRAYVISAENIAELNSSKFSVLFPEKFERFSIQKKRRTQAKYFSITQLKKQLHILIFKV